MVDVGEYYTIHGSYGSEICVVARDNVHQANQCSPMEAARLTSGKMEGTLNMIFGQIIATSHDLTPRGS